MTRKSAPPPDPETKSSSRSTLSDITVFTHQENLFRLLVSRVRDYALFVLDLQGRIATWNAGAERIKGYRAEEIIGKHFSVLYPPEDVAAGKCARELEAAIRDGSFEEEGWRLRKDGTPFWASVLITALRDDAGELVGYAKITRDLTDRLRADEQRLRLARAQENDRRKDDFLAVIGHELRNPLSPMTTAVHLIKTQNVPEIARPVEILERQLSQLTRLLDDLMDVARTLRDNVQIDAQPTEISTVLRRALDVSDGHFTTSDHALSIDVPEHGLVVNVDIERMTQVFGNILNNAAKYTNPGGQIFVRAWRDGANIAVRIRDTGHGIEERNLQRVFELFTQGERGLDRRGGGLGVGLAIAKELIERHGGFISVESPGINKGTTFTVRLPRNTVMDTPLPFTIPKQGNAIDAGSKRKILVIDDNEDGAELLREALCQGGHDVQIAFEGSTGLALAETFHPDIVLLDIGLPGLSGYDVARALRNTAHGRTIPIIAISGYASASHRNEALRAGFSAHIAKPVNITTLQALIATLPPQE